MRVVAWGTYDKGKPRVRILLDGLRQNGIEIVECHADIWNGVEDKACMRKSWKLVPVLLRWIFSYPKLVINYLLLPKHDAVFVGYMGHLDAIVLWPFAKLRGVPVIWDAFLSIYNTIVEDRGLTRRLNPLSFIVCILEFLACCASNLILLDTNSHIDYFCKKYPLPPEKFLRVFVGVENNYFSELTSPYKAPQPNEPLKILFYGQFIPLHGIEHIISTARLLEEQNIEFTIIGNGQEKEKIDNMLTNYPLPKLKWILWVPYKNLSEWIGDADICLGIFGNSQKASQVIPNKVFQVLACGKPLITRDSPAIRELLTPEMPGIRLVPPADPNRMAEAILDMREELISIPPEVLHQNLIKTLIPKAIGKTLKPTLVALVKSPKGTF
ncbi:hypothetical protein A7E78_03525 [Syntrophotalea acetylenivorans]|uniref:Glycosyl transferase family 1 domain-containing protein n=1 Tax=Syntrophotalea acetylenivorans TaxID=1842532 RepID=A0A1L3GM19_9BACT|nr:glycosyltransferase [Syntrophotalea acetylenivorans]APG26983.1 hypothetical protein A7E78_03525 [Syntrophotalea acetylenivorans]